MKKRAYLGIILAMFSLIVTACGSNTAPASEGSSAASSSKSNSKSSTSQGPKKSIEITNANLMNEGGKAYVRVTGSQTNYTADDFTWAWGIMDTGGDFVDGKVRPSESDFQKVSFESDNTFTLKYCLTDITTIKAGKLYRVYGGTPESYGEITFPSNQTGANDTNRKYYLRNDENNALTFDSIQPISFTKASIVEISESDLPDGVTTAGAYVKFGGENKSNITLATIEEWHTAGNIAGNFQRMKGGEYLLHDHVDTERFWKIEGNYLYVYLYVGFIAKGEGWMTHFDFVGGNAGGNLQLDATIDGEEYIASGNIYKLYALKNNGNEENYWGCLGIYREA